jgi:Fur family ferric uptake transcriptional regulator
MKNLHRTFEDFLVTQDSRYTSQKRVIADEIFGMKSHFEVEDFVVKLRGEHNSLSRATVYRTIKQLLDAGLLQKISTRDGKVFYEKIASEKQHDHLICNSCGKIIEIKDDTVGAYVDTLCKKQGFLPEYRSIHIYGLCKQCQKKG